MRYETRLVYFSWGEAEPVGGGERSDSTDDSCTRGERSRRLLSADSALPGAAAATGSHRSHSSGGTSPRSHHSCHLRRSPAVPRSCLCCGAAHSRCANTLTSSFLDLPAGFFGLRPSWVPLGSLGSALWGSLTFAWASLVSLGLSASLELSWDLPGGFFTQFRQVFLGFLDLSHWWLSQVLPGWPWYL